MSLNDLARMRVVSLIPDLKFLVITNTSEFVAIYSVPRNVLNNLRMGVPTHQRINFRRELVRLIYIPKTNLVVVTAAK